jgi:putative membrane protein
MALVDWTIPWEPSITLVFSIGISAVLYLIGSSKVQVPYRNRLSFWCGLISIYLVLHTQFDYYSEQAFFMHRIQHSVLHHLGPFLIALSHPGTAIWMGIPASWRKNITLAVKLKSVSWTVDFLNNPIVAVTLFCALIIFWMLPQIHVVAMLDWRWYRIMNWSMVINGLMFWNLVLNSYSIRAARLSSGCRIAMMLAIIPPQIVMGALLVFNDHEIYAIYSLCGLVFSGLNGILDQQIGGIILWVNGAMMSMIGILIVIYTDWMAPRPIKAAA